MKKIYMSITFICIALWIVGLLFFDLGLEVHLFLIMAGLSFSLKLLTEELNIGR